MTRKQIQTFLVEHFILMIKFSLTAYIKLVTCDRYFFDTLVSMILQGKQSNTLYLYRSASLTIPVLVFESSDITPAGFFAFFKIILTKL